MEERIVRITAPSDKNSIRGLRAGDKVLLSGDILVFRDQVHRFLCDIIRKGGDLPFNLENELVYYCGPTPALHGMPVGSAGPTTSSRMDTFTGPLLERGLLGMIGKGDRSPAVVELIEKFEVVYLVAVGGTGAFLAKQVTASRVIAYPELGPEAARVFTVHEFPLHVGVDSRGESAFAAYKAR